MIESDWRVGIVGLGALGLPIAVNLHQAGLSLQVHTRSRRAENDPQLGEARPCINPAAAADNVDVLLLCVSDDSAVNNVLFGPDGAAERGSVNRDSTVLVDPRKRIREHAPVVEWGLDEGWRQPNAVPLPWPDHDCGVVVGGVGIVG